jgi:hypothetical protein
MRVMDQVSAFVAQHWAALYAPVDDGLSENGDPDGGSGRSSRSGARSAGDRGDVPGWVMVTVMTAILVVAILGVFEPEIKTAISGAIDRVTNSGTQ